MMTPHRSILASNFSTLHTKVSGNHTGSSKQGVDEYDAACRRVYQLMVAGLHMHALERRETGADDAASCQLDARLTPSSEIVILLASWERCLQRLLLILIHVSRSQELHGQRAEPSLY